MNERRLSLRGSPARTRLPPFGGPCRPQDSVSIALLFCLPTEDPREGCLKAGASGEQGGAGLTHLGPAGHSLASHSPCEGQLFPTTPACPPTGHLGPLQPPICWQRKPQEATEEARPSLACAGMEKWPGYIYSWRKTAGRLQPGKQPAVRGNLAIKFLKHTRKLTHPLSKAPRGLQGCGWPEGALGSLGAGLGTEHCPSSSRQLS